MMILGFVALLKQKAYLDKSGKPTHIELPLIGKMRTNYPSLIFVFLATFLIYTGYTKSLVKPKNEWVITGSFTDSLNRIDNWENRLTIHPCEIKDASVSSTGDFKIIMDITEGNTFEEVVERVYYATEYCSKDFSPKQEFDLYHQFDGQSLLKEYDNTTRKYSRFQINKY